MGEVAAPGGNISRIASGRNPFGRRVPPGQFQGEAERRAAGPFDKEAVVVGVAPAPPDFTRRDEVEPDEAVCRSAECRDAVQRRPEAEAERPGGRGGPVLVERRSRVDEPREPQAKALGGNLLDGEREPGGFDVLLAEDTAFAGRGPARR